MLFLLNDAMFNLDAGALAPPLPSERFHTLTLEFVQKLGRELYAEEPLLHLSSPERARRLASLIVLKAPTVNAAIFIAPSPRCSPDLVQSRFVQVGFEVMAELFIRHQSGRLTNVEADRQVWRRLAA